MTEPMTGVEGRGEPEGSAPTKQRAHSLPFMLLMASAVGLVAGVGAWGFRLLIGLVHNLFFLGSFSAAYDANLHTPEGVWGMGVILVPVVGGLVVVFLVKNFAPEAKGHGVPEVMDAIYYNQGRIRPRVALVKSLASAISIGSGGSVGREGPIVQIGSSFGSTLGSLMGVRVGDRATLIAAGAGAGIAATFNAPLGGIVFAVELLLVAVNARTLLITVTATVIATHISHLLLGTDPSFYLPLLEKPDFQMEPTSSLVAFLVLGGLMGFVSVAYIRGLYAMEDVFDAIPGNDYTRHVLGMFCVGLMMWLLMRETGHYYVEGVGYATIMDILQGSLTDPTFLLGLAALKLLATCLSLGSGGSGGVFSPALFMGAAGGAAFGHLAAAMVPGLEVAIPVFAIAGMAGVIAGSTGALLTGIIMLAEMTMDHSIVVPLAICGSAAYAVRKGLMNESIYTMKLRARGHSVPEGLHSSVLTSERIEDLMAREFVLVADGREIPPGAAIAVFSDAQRIVSVASPGASIGRTVNYIVVSEEATPLAVLTAIWKAEAEVVLVSRDPDAQRASDVVGVLFPATLIRLLETDEALS
jgi:CIC family chloride channel protein